MFNIKATKDTELFKATGEIVKVPKGKEFLVEEFISSPMYPTVVLSHDAGTWMLHSLDWSGIPTAVTSSEIPTEHQKGFDRFVTYYSQRDNFTQANRTCFSSTAAMILKFHKPDAIKDDNEYLRRVLELGDSTDASVQIKALATYGLTATFSQDRSIDWLRHQVSGKHGNVVGIGFLHHGPKEIPSGGGHWVLCFGWDHEKDEAMIHDPWKSDFDHKNGLYRSNAPGKDQRFSTKMLKARWTVESPHSGWALWVE